MITQLTADIDWLHECHPVDDRHIHSSAYVVHAPDGTILVDTGDLHYRDAILKQIETATDGAGLDGLFISKSHLPHAANVRAITEAWPDVEIVFPGGIHNVHGFPEVTQWPHHATTEWFGREFSTTRGPLIDIDHTTWLYDHAEEVFFTIDGFCYYHSPGDCARRSDELSNPFGAGDIQALYEDILLWLQYCNPEKVIAGTHEVLENREISYIAPGHGNPIHRDDLDEYLSTLEEAIRTIAPSA